MELFSSWTGSDFLLFYSVLLGFAGVSAWWMPGLLREPGRRAALDDVDSIAVLVGGPTRLADSALAELYVHGGLVGGEKGKLAVTPCEAPVSPAAKTLLAAGEQLSRADAKKALDTHADVVAARLQFLRDPAVARFLHGEAMAFQDAAHLCRAAGRQEPFAPDGLQHGDHPGRVVFAARRVCGHITAPICQGTNSAPPKPSSSESVLSPEATATIFCRISRPFVSIVTPSRMSPQLMSMSSRIRPYISELVASLMQGLGL